ncbi:MAG: DUF2809 domain-containing protein [Pyrinomonadaceae bacterium]|nr:DUF2809 domain-containing protein [Pyrinomonadaceae bacterium]
MKQNRQTYFTLAVTIIALGLASRQYASQLPKWNVEYVGDVLYGLMIFTLIKLLSPALSIRLTAIIAAAFCLIIELSQLYNAPWFDSIKKTTVGALIFGKGFSYNDLACYAAGILIGVAIVNVLHRTTAKGANAKGFAKRR